MKNLKFDPKNWEWYAYLDASEEIKDKYIDRANYLAGGWPTCACGQVCGVLPKGKFSAPLDAKLYKLGNLFACSIEYKEWIDAKETLDKIEARTIFLLKQPNYIDPKTL